MKFPIATSTFEAQIPHRPPMVWVDEVLSATPIDGECRVNLRADGLYFKDGQFLEVGFIEMTAQSFGFVRMALALCQTPKLNAKVEEGLLVGMKDFKIFVAPDDPDLKPGRNLHIHVNNYREFGMIVLLDGQVHSDSGRLLASGNLRVFQRTEEIS